MLNLPLFVKELLDRKLSLNLLRLSGSEEGADSLSGGTSEGRVHLANGVADLQHGQSLSLVGTPGGLGLAALERNTLAVSLDGVGVSNTGVLEGVLVLQVTWVFAELNAARLSGLDQVGVVVSDDAPDDLLRHVGGM